MDSQLLGRIKVQLLLHMQGEFSLQEAIDELKEFTPSDIASVIKAISGSNGILKKARHDRYLFPEYEDDESIPRRVSMKGTYRR